MTKIILHSNNLVYVGDRIYDGFMIDKCRKLQTLVNVWNNNRLDYFIIKDTGLECYLTGGTYVANACFISV
jgi:hypothetical protein